MQEKVSYSNRDTAGLMLAGLTKLRAVTPGQVSLHMCFVSVLSLSQTRYSLMLLLAHTESYKLPSGHQKSYQASCVSSQPVGPVISSISQVKFIFRGIHVHVSSFPHTSLCQGTNNHIRRRLFSTSYFSRLHCCPGEFQVFKLQYDHYKVNNNCSHDRRLSIF